VVAVIVAIVSASSLIGGNAFDTPFPYIGLVALFFVWWFVILPHQRAERRARQASGEQVMATGTAAPPGQAYAPPPPPGHAPTTAAGTAPVPAASPRPRNPRHDRGLLTILTIFVAMIAVGALWLYTL